MESFRILVGDHTGTIKILDSETQSLGTAAKNKSILNIIPKEDLFLSIHEDGSIEEFDESGQFNSIRPSSSKITDAFFIENTVGVAYPNGSIDFQGTLQTSQTVCNGIYSNQQFLAICGTSPVELWDVEARKMAWKGWTVKPREEVSDNKCWISGNEITTVTMKNEVFLYDIRAGKKPRKVSQLNKPGEVFFFPLFSLHCLDDLIFAGDGVGNVYKINKDLTVLGKTKGRSCGAVLSIFVKEGKVFSCGLDRRLMMHEVSSMKLVEKKYLWQKLTKVLVVD